MEFFSCPCPGAGMVILDGKTQGANRSTDETLHSFVCDTGRHRVALVCQKEEACIEAQQEVEILGTTPVQPLEVIFHCRRG